VSQGADLLFHRAYGYSKRGAGMRTIDLSGKAALITGGTRNIGRAIAQSLAEAGADVALFYRSNEAAATRAREEIRASTGRRAEVYRVDVGDETAVEAGVEKALDDFGGAMPIVVHNAMGHRNIGGLRMPDIRPDQWRDVLAVNLDAAFFLTRALLRRQGALPPGSSAVFIASSRGQDPAAGHAAYGTAKGVDLLCRHDCAGRRPARRPCQRRLSRLHRYGPCA
jgi:3-oxoacyl-[acyl-carrier protein] reductase